MRNPAAFHAPLNPKDTEKQTVGCRHTQPEICAKNRMPKKCAFGKGSVRSIYTNS